MMNIDLSNKERSITSIVQNNHDKLDACTSVKTLVDTLKELFNEYNLDTKATKRLIANVSAKRNLTDALLTVYNSMLCGAKLSVDQK